MKNRDEVWEGGPEGLVGEEGEVGEGDVVGLMHPHLLERRQDLQHQRFLLHSMIQIWGKGKGRIIEKMYFLIIEFYIFV